MTKEQAELLLDAVLRIEYLVQQYESDMPVLDTLCDLRDTLKKLMIELISQES
jgi:hypothetical protein